MANDRNINSTSLHHCGRRKFSTPRRTVPIGSRQLGQFCDLAGIPVPRLNGTVEWCSSSGDLFLPIMVTSVWQTLQTPILTKNLACGLGTAWAGLKLWRLSSLASNCRCDTLAH